MSASKTPSNEDLAFFSKAFYYNSNTGILYHKYTKGSNALIDQEAGCVLREGYRQVRANKKKWATHRVAWFLYYGKWPTLEIDHINGNGFDNRIINLREVSTCTNALNRYFHRNGTPQGITKVNRPNCKKPYRVRIPKEYNGKILSNRRHVGYFASIEEAKQALENYHRDHNGN
jgi:hypothetical protein